MTLAELADLFGVSKSSIFRAAHRISWAHVA
jgi:DNA-binding MurR/RpiR family transcriptional regulator